MAHSAAAETDIGPATSKEIKGLDCDVVLWAISGLPPSVPQA